MLANLMPTIAKYSFRYSILVFVNVVVIFGINKTSYRLESGWRSGHQSRLPPLRPGIESARGFFSGRSGFPPSANSTFTPRSEPSSD